MLIREWSSWFGAAATARRVVRRCVSTPPVVVGVVGLVLVCDAPMGGGCTPALGVEEGGTRRVDDGGRGGVPPHYTIVH